MSPRRSERELARDVDDLEPDDAEADLEPILYQDPVTGEYRTSDGATIDATAAEFDPIMIIETADLPAPAEGQQ